MPRKNDTAVTITVVAILYQRLQTLCDYTNNKKRNWSYCKSIEEFIAFSDGSFEDADCH